VTVHPRPPTWPRPNGLAFRGTELYWSEEGNQLVRKLDLARPASTQTVLGIGTNIQAGSRFQATQVSLTSPSDVACCDPAGDAFITDELNTLVYRLSPDGYLSIAAGIPGLQAFEPPIEGVPAKESPLARPGALALDAAGNLFIADAGQGGLIQKVVASTGLRFTLVAPGTFSYPGALATGPGALALRRRSRTSARSSGWTSTRGPSPRSPARSPPAWRSMPAATSSSPYRTPTASSG
jgi:sugar lactone lactonase YvrE